MTLQKLFCSVAIGQAVSDYHYDKVFNGYEPGTPQYLCYQEKIEELELIYASQEANKH